MSITIDHVRERLPHWLGHMREHLGKVPLKPPPWPRHAAGMHWIDWRTVVAGLLLGGIVHICYTLAASVSGSGQGYRMLVDQLSPNVMTVLPQQAPGRQILPELPPDMLYAMCRYDLTGGPVAVRATVQGPGWALSVHTPQGANIYVLTGQPDRTTDVSFLLVPNAPEVVQSIPRRENAADTQIASPSLDGVVMLRAPVRGLAWTAETEALVQRATCTQVKE